MRKVNWPGNGHSVHVPRDTVHHMCVYVHERECVQVVLGSLHASAWWGCMWGPGCVIGG